MEANVQSRAGSGDRDAYTEDGRVSKSTTKNWLGSRGTIKILELLDIRSSEWVSTDVNQRASEMESNLSVLQTVVAVLFLNSDRRAYTLWA
jgi:hypothetical protein